MKFLITEDQYEKLIQASRERHSKDPNPNIKSGGFDLDGDVITYSVTVRNDYSVYVNYTYNGKRSLAYITNEEKFIRLSKEEQRSLVKSKIMDSIQKKSQ